MARPQVRDTTPLAPPLTAEVDQGMAYEALLALSMFTGDETQESYEVGKPWFRRARRAVSSAFVETLKRLVGTAGPRWFLLLGMVHESGGDRSVGSFLNHLESNPPGEVLAALLGGALRTMRNSEGRALLAAAVGGDRKAAAAIAARTHKDTRVIESLAALGPDRAKAMTIEVIQRWDREFFATEAAGPASQLAKDAAELSRAVNRTPALELVERATGGVSYEVEAGIDRVLLVPSLVTRPWITITEWDSTKIFCYRAGLGAVNPDGPNPDMVLAYRALGDETRLRLLRELAKGDRRLAELAQALGLAKSTIHGHLVVLRTAGLVRLTIGSDKRYGLRTTGLPDLNGILSDYIGR